MIASYDRSRTVHVPLIHVPDPLFFLSVYSKLYAATHPACFLATYVLLEYFTKKRRARNQLDDITLAFRRDTRHARILTKLLQNLSINARNTRCSYFSLKFKEEGGPSKDL